MSLIYLLILCLAGSAIALLIILRKNKSLIISISNLQQENTDHLVELEKFRTKYERILDVEKAVDDKAEEFDKIREDLIVLNDKYQTGKQHFSILQKELSMYEEDLDTISFGLYKPRHSYDTSDEFKNKIDLNYRHQKEMIKHGKATNAPTDWTVNGSAAEGRKMVHLNIKNMLYAFNGECDALIAKVKWNNATKSIERLQKSFESINKLGTVNKIQITRPYYNLKLNELTLTHEYENKKQEEKEEQKRIREQMREEEKVLKDIERTKKEADEEERRYQKALLRVQEDLKYAKHEDIDELSGKVAELEMKLKEAEQKRQRAMSMAEQTRAGHIYVISNIGSFGEDVYKIGMTRRLEPLDRIKELSDAAVPFRYDVHAIIFSEDAPALEHELHKRFHQQRLNKVNGRKEFFKVSLQQIETIVREHTDAEIEFTLLAEAQEYRETMSMIEAMLKAAQVTPPSIEEKYPDSLL